tara:strand:- start:662 stop:829 length:168 start_codon:yes stop_codon:yes gene_type:complete
MSDTTLSANDIIFNAIIGIIIYSFGYHRTSPLLNKIVSKVDQPSAENAFGVDTNE